MVKELKEINKPFIIVLNSVSPSSTPVQQMRFELEQKYNVPVMAVNCLQLNQSDIFSIIETVLFEFGIQEIKISLPGYTSSLGNDHWLKKELYAVILDSTKNISKIREINNAADNIAKCEYIDNASIQSTNLGNGKIVIDIKMKDNIYYKILSEAANTEIASDAQLMKYVTDLSAMQKEYNKVAYALEEVKSKGYGIVTPNIDELVLEEPQIVKHGGRFGVKLRASAPSIHVA
ncbi:Stage IV sporulation protein A [bioreactor metagenome]|uniref:Stage IV sporulation protein A n=1 Tax=bioreactor metagenome TaxID=1076179 RepID=A0A645FTA3_9ZZZZ